ncbi:MAG: hypothetical protein D6727_04105, partial [Gammaproteobacteria bacterium]
GKAPAAGPSGAGQLPETGRVGGPAASAEDVFNESLGDFDGEIAREREAMASTGQGSVRGAMEREARDVAEVKEAGEGRVASAGATADRGRPGEMAGLPGETAPGSEPPPAGESQAGGETARVGQDEAGGGGQDEVRSGLEGGGAEDSARDGARVAEIPDDIPADGSADDQVARQIREAAMAEKDPEIRAALWDEYRRYTGLDKKR